jgi:hypothetical protein
MRRAFAVEVRLIRRSFIRKIPAAFDHQRSRWNRSHRLALGSRHRRSRDRAVSTARCRLRHLRALLFQNRLAR